MKPYFKSKDNRFTLYYEDCIEVMQNLPECSIDMIFADPPYFLSNGGLTCKSGKAVSVNKGDWDKSKSITDDHIFNFNWIKECQRLLTKDGTIWISGTFHNISSVGLCLQTHGFRILNNVIWQKTNPPPNLGCRCFTHSTETILWAAKSDKSKYFFNYKEMKKINNDKQMKDVWQFSSSGKKEKLQGKHPTQKPLALLERIIVASTQPDDLILDPFSGSSTTGIMAYRLGRKYIGIEKEKEYLSLSKKRFKAEFKNGN